MKRAVAANLQMTNPQITKISPNTKVPLRATLSEKNCP